jgi:MoaA/NifB/PqqE/SkfB family radical SAM enzyme
VTRSIKFSKKGHYFQAAPDVASRDLLDEVDRPLSVIYQVTRRCNFDCDFCSEIEQLPDPTLDEIAAIESNLQGVQRVFLSGGEPLIRRDFVDIVDIFKEHNIAVPTNATRGHKVASDLAGRIAFANIGLEGPRAITGKVRGNYEAVMRGAHAFREAGVPLSVSAVVLRSILDALPYTVQIADVLGAGKVKLIHPIRKGNGLNLPDSEFLSLDESKELFEHLTGLKERYGWTPALRMTTWTRETEGYSVLVYPNGKTYAWPVYGGIADEGTQGGPEDKVLYLGDVSEEPISTIWERYPFKLNHLRKYLGRSILVDENTARY